MKGFGKYILEEFIGKGGMAEVYKARLQPSGRIFAVKILYHELSHHNRIRQRFLREANLQAALRHPNLIKCYDIGEIDGRMYLAMEYIQGLSLSNLVNQTRHPLPWRLAVSMMIQALAGLQYLHENGVIHRDIKPQNLLLTIKQGVVSENNLLKLSDLGIAKDLSSDGMTLPNSRLGTLLYMSPEQILSPNNVDHRSDLYSLGITFFELLTLTPPYSNWKTEFDLIERISRGQSLSLKRLRPDLPDWFSLVIERMIKTDPAARYKNAREIIKSIQTHLNEKPRRQQIL